jgi:hypothetical protein
MIAGIASEVLEIFFLCSQHRAAQTHSSLQRGHAALSANSAPYQPACNLSPSGDIGRVILHRTSTERSIWLCYTEELKMRSAGLSSTLDRLEHASNLKSKYLYLEL